MLQSEEKVANALAIAIGSLFIFFACGFPLIHVAVIDKDYSLVALSPKAAFLFAGLTLIAITVREFVRPFLIRILGVFALVLVLIIYVAVHQAIANPKLPFVAKYFPILMVLLSKPGAALVTGIASKAVSFVATRSVSFYWYSWVALSIGPLFYIFTKSNIPENQDLEKLNSNSAHIQIEINSPTHQQEINSVSRSVSVRKKLGCWAHLCIIAFSIIVGLIVKNWSMSAVIIFIYLLFIAPVIVLTIVILTLVLLFLFLFNV